jgi:hypothetical protein
MVRMILSTMIIARVKQQHVILTHVLIPPPYLSANHYGVVCLDTL